jgi:hypothetical protein
LAYVVHAAEAGGQWSVGCAFARPLTEDDLEAFGAERVEDCSGEQRDWARFPCAASATYQVVAAADQAKWPARVLDLSANGAGLVVRQPIDAGALLSVELQGARPESARVLLACVARATPGAGGERILGCNFIRELGEKELQALVEGPV